MPPLLEMAFAGGCGLHVALPAAAGAAPAQLFSEELGVVVQIMAADEPRFEAILAQHGLSAAALYLGAPTSDMRVQIKIGAVEFDESWVDLRRAWSETSWRMRRLLTIRCARMKSLPRKPTPTIPVCPSL